tara:strand:- start:7711 stop:8076 length:366 start_codon:yes stop_codon:yes gene_type:complete
MGNKSRTTARKRRHKRVRRKVYGTSTRPRLNVFRSSKHIWAQLIDDEQGLTVAQASTLESKFRGQEAQGTQFDRAKTVGAVVADRAKEKGINRVVFDRSGYKYHGRVKALADAARDAGLQF